jgi:hypothetical protein
MIRVHVGKDARRGIGQWVRGGVFVVSCIDPTHYAKATHVIEINWLKQEEAEVGEADPIATILMAREVLLSNRREIRLGHRYGVADKSGSRSPQRIGVSTYLPDEEAAARIFLQVLRVHCHIADQEDRPTCGIKGEWHQ